MTRRKILLGYLFLFTFLNLVMAANIFIDNMQPPQQRKFPMELVLSQDESLTLANFDSAASSIIQIPQPESIILQSLKADGTGMKIEITPNSISINGKKTKTGRKVYDGLLLFMQGAGCVK